MKIDVLLSTMDRTDHAIVDKCRITGGAVVINQCQKNECVEFINNNQTVKFISVCARGLSKSRNLALSTTDADICIICDDDVEYLDGYEATVERAFSEIPDADIIVFNVNSLNTDKRPQEKLFRKVKKVPWYKAYSSVHIAFKRKSIVSNELWFNENFGAGSGMYSFAEDSLFFDQAHKLKLNIYTYPAVIANLYTEGSSWFRGYDAKYFFDLGAYLAAGSPIMRHIIKFYYPFRLRKKTKINALQMLYYIDRGMLGYKKHLSYSDMNPGSSAVSG